MYKVNNIVKKFYIYILIGILTLQGIIFSIYMKKINLDNKEINYSNIINNWAKINNLYSVYNNENVVIENNFFGRMIIEKIDIDYMVLKEYTEDNLKKSICRLNGDNIEENISFIGHNYENGIFFSNINKLKLEDEIKLIIGNKVYVYNVYKKYEVDKMDLSPLENNNFSEITLITCNNFSKKRYIVKAKIKANDKKIEEKRR